MEVPKVTLFKGAGNRSFFVSENRWAAEEAARKALKKKVKSHVCFVVGDDMYLEDPKIKGRKVMVAAFHDNGGL